MKNQFVPCEIALMAKEKGFNDDCLACYQPKYKSKDLLLRGCGALYFDIDGLYNNSTDPDILCASPLYQQLVDWFSEKHNIEIELHRNDDGYFDIRIYKWKSYSISEGDHLEDGFSEVFYTCESQDRYESYNIGFKEAFKLI